METPNFYAIIPATVRYCEDLIPTAKLLYGEITALCNERGFCWASNSHFAKLYNVSDFTVSRWISQLEAKGFIWTQIDKSAGNQRLIYINDSVPLLRKSARGIDEKRKTLLTKSAKPSCGKAQDPIDEKRNHNNTVNNKENNTVSRERDARAENQPDFEKNKKEKAPLIPGAPPAGPGPGRPAATTFAESIWSTATTGSFAQALHDYAPETADADAGYYRNRCRDWSAQNPGKLKPDWIAFAAQIIGDDRGKNKLVTIQPISHNGINHNSHSAGSPSESLIDNENIRRRAAAIADRWKAKNPGRYQ